MYSDDWIRADYKTTNPIRVNDVLNYCIWQNQSGKYIGITLNFELASDVHIEVKYDNWMDFIKKELYMGQEMCNVNISEYLKTITWLELENRLEFQGIEYEKIHF